MAALDWASVVTDLNTAKQGTAWAEEYIAAALIADLTNIGTPYDTVYDSGVDAQKSSDVAYFSAALAAWGIEAEGTHDQTFKSTRYAEDVLSLTARSEIPWSSNVSIMSVNKNEMVTRLGTYAAVARGSDLGAAAGLSAMLLGFLDEFKTIYDARPAQTYTGSYGVDRTVNVPDIGAITVAKAEELLQALMDEGNRLLEDVVFTP